MDLIVLKIADHGGTNIVMAQELPDEGAPSPIRSNDIEVDFARHQVTLGGSVINLKPLEFDLLAFLVRNRGRAFSRDQLLEKVWEYDYEGDTRTVDVHIRWLREKLESDPKHPTRILTVRGVGYKLQPQES